MVTDLLDQHFLIEDPDISNLFIKISNLPALEITYDDQLLYLYHILHTMPKNDIWLNTVPQIRAMLERQAVQKTDNIPSLAHTSAMLERQAVQNDDNITLEFYTIDEISNIESLFKDMNEYLYHTLRTMPQNSKNDIFLNTSHQTRAMLERQAVPKTDNIPLLAQTSTNLQQQAVQNDDNIPSEFYTTYDISSIESLFKDMGEYRGQLKTILGFGQDRGNSLYESHRYNGYKLQLFIIVDDQVKLHLSIKYNSHYIRDTKYHTSIEQKRIKRIKYKNNRPLEHLSERRLSLYNDTHLLEILSDYMLADYEYTYLLESYASTGNRPYVKIEKKHKCI